MFLVLFGSDPKVGSTSARLPHPPKHRPVYLALEAAAKPRRPSLLHTNLCREDVVAPGHQQRQGSGSGKPVPKIRTEVCV